MKIIIEYIDRYNEIDYNIKVEKYINGDGPNNKCQIIETFISDFENKYNIPVYAITGMLYGRLSISKDKYDNEDKYFLNKIFFSNYFQNLEYFNKKSKLYNSNFIKYSVVIEDLNFEY